jgi:multidrug efflux pump subunit AcrB
MAGEFARMQDTFRSMAGGLVLASLLIYFLMVALGRSFVVPLTVMLVVPLSLAGVLPVLYFTKTALNVQSLLGIIFVVGIIVANTVLLTDFAQGLRRTEGLSPTEAIRRAAAVRVRPVTMTALAAFFAMVPAALAIERGSEANAPLARAILGGLLVGVPGALLVLPALYSLIVRDTPVGEPPTAAAV